VAALANVFGARLLQVGYLGLAIGGMRGMAFHASGSIDRVGGLPARQKFMEMIIHPTAAVHDIRVAFQAIRISDGKGQRGRLLSRTGIERCGVTCAQHNRSQTPTGARARMAVNAFGVLGLVKGG
jgi:hypothetical protein